MTNDIKDNSYRPLAGLFNDSFPPVLDGVSMALVNYATILADMGWQTRVVTPANPDMTDTGLDVMPYFSIPIINRRPYRYGYPKLDFSIRRRLRNTPFSIIHTHSPFSAGRLAVYAARHHNVPLVATFHSKYRTDLQRSLKHFPALVNLAMRRILELYNSCDEVWIPQAEVEDTIRSYGFRGRLTVVENGNDFADLPAARLPEFRAEARKRLGIPQGKPVFLFVGQHILEKGICVIAEALAMLKEIDFEMNYIGTGYATDLLRQTVNRLGISHKTKIHGVISDRDILRDYYAASDLFLFPSLYDNAPLVMREAAAMGTPTLIPRGATAAGVISDASNGFLFDGSAQSLAATLRCLCSDKNLISSVGLTARSSLARGWDDVVAEVSLRYKDIISGFKKNRHGTKIR